MTILTNKIEVKKIEIQKKIETDFLLVVYDVPNHKQHSKLALMTTITMPRALDVAVLSIISETRTKTILVLAEKFGFSVEDATSYIDAQELKVERKRGPAPKKKKEKLMSEDAEAKPKRSPTGYLMFSKSARASVRAEMSGELVEGTKLAPQAVVKELAKRWKALDEEERLSWNATALETAAQPATVSLDDVVLKINREESVGPDGSEDGFLLPLGVTRTASVSWNENRLPAEAPVCTHIGQCSCGW